ncbi:MAG: PIN domain-containing protein [Clostridiales bacterium]|jgi:predicted nucleic acid-binding protein|nr:PIN domain-containing protein [Clostridiales bacterium]
MIYALDTNIISYILNGNAALDERLNAVTKSGNKVVIPLMVYYEARRGLLNNNAINKMRVFEKLCAKLNVNNLTTSDMNTAAAIYDKHKRAGTPIDDSDILIAAQCINNDYTLVTNNVKHFNNIDGLTFENWI